MYINHRHQNNSDKLIKKKLIHRSKQNNEQDDLTLANQ